MKFNTIESKPHIKYRIFATLIDYAIFFSMMYLYITFFGHETTDGYQVDGAAVLPIIIFWFLYFVVLEWNASTPGHDIFKLKIVLTDGHRPSLSTIFKRRLLDFVDIGFYGIPALICISKTTRHQRLGDLWAGTLVVKAGDVIEKQVVF